MSAAILEVTGVEREFGGLRALAGVTMSVQKGEIFGVIGPNGAGKTTLLNILAGSLRPSAGSVLFKGQDITRLAADRRARLGIGRTFQSAYTFKSETVEENIYRGFVFRRYGLPRDLFLGRSSGGADALGEKIVCDVAAFLGLEGQLSDTAGALPYGLQKLLGIGMALAAGPAVLLMDEPAAGLNPAETSALGKLLIDLRSRRGVDIILVEHDMKMVMDICDRILVLNYGRPICVDVPSRVRADERVVEAYLGAEYEFA